MRDLKPIQSRIHALRAIASQQHGYFTYKQAIDCKYLDCNHLYHINKGNWLKVSTGLFRLPDFLDSMESDFTRYCLWSRNQKDQPQGVISHYSAMAFHGLWEYNSDEVHLTVPNRFRKVNPDEIIIHKAALSLSSIESHCSFMVTRLRHTLLDMQAELKNMGRWDYVANRVLAEGRLSREDMLNLGVISSPVTASGYNIKYRLFSGRKTPDIKLPLNSAQSGEYVSGTAVVDPVSEGVWKMIYDRTETGRRKSRAGFTLVELLVVVAIISILASLMLPMLGKALTTARTMKCSNKLRQMGEATLIYADQYRGALPTLITVTGNIANYWPYQIAPLLDTTYTFVKYNHDEIWHCPEDYPTTIWGSYGINSNLRGDFLHRRKDATRTPLYSDYNNSAATLRVLVGSLPGELFYFNFRHNNGVNMIFLDTHVKFLRESDLSWSSQDWSN
jgi:prepilin-type N-terminal cleavage/methylation domain-containing protein/prepilin-type processing-associated H-X9-DG protein